MWETPKYRDERNGKIIIVENTYTQQGALLGNGNYTKTAAEIIINVLWACTNRRRRVVNAPKKTNKAQKALSDCIIGRRPQTHAEIYGRSLDISGRQIYS